MSKRGFYIVFIVLMSIFSCKKKDQLKPELLSGKWERIADFPGRYRSNAFGFTIGNKGYVTGGSYIESQPNEYDKIITLNDLWEYDPSTNRWTPKAAYPGIGLISEGFEIGGKGYLHAIRIVDSAGSIPVPLHEFYEYDPSTDKWTKKTDFAGVERDRVIAFSIGQTGYMGLGNDHVGTFLGVLNDFWKYDVVADNWTRVADYPPNMDSSLSFSCNGKGYVFTDYFNNGEGNSLWQYDPLLDKWTEKTKNSQGNHLSSGKFVIGTMAYLGIGGSPGPVHTKDGWTLPYSNDVMEYNGQTDNWTRKAGFPAEARLGLVCFSVNNAGYSGLGSTFDGTTSIQFWKFTP